MAQYTYDPTQGKVVPVSQARVVTYTTNNPDGMPATPLKDYNATSTAGDELIKSQEAASAAPKTSLAERLDAILFELKAAEAAYAAAVENEESNTIVNKAKARLNEARKAYDLSLPQRRDITPVVTATPTPTPTPVVTPTPTPTPTPLTDYNATSTEGDELNKKQAAASAAPKTSLAERLDAIANELKAAEAAYAAAVKNQESSTIITRAKERFDEAKKAYDLSAPQRNDIAAADAKAAAIVAANAATKLPDIIDETNYFNGPTPTPTPVNTPMSKEEWEALQLKLPPEDRVSYEDYVKSFAAGATPAPVVVTPTPTPVVTTTNANEQNRQSVIAILTDRFNRYGLGSLASKIKELAIDGASEATITIGLQETEEYKMRFSANEDRRKKNLKVLTPAEYLNLEDGYRQILRSYGLKQFDTDDYVKKFISNDVSASELSDRVVTAVQRVQNADPAIMQTLRDYYGITNESLVGYVLDPNQQLQKIQRQVAAAEIGTAARRQGLEAGVAVADQLAAQGISEAEAQKGYATIADILPSAEKLSQIYGGTMDKYGQSEGEQEVFNSLASAQRKRTGLSKREIAEFQGTSGINRTSLTSSTKGGI